MEKNITESSTEFSSTSEVTNHARQHTLPRGVAFWMLAAIMGFLLFAAAAPSPIYEIYQARWHFSDTTLTVVFAVYAIAVLAALLTLGSLSDRLGRRPVLAGALVIEIAAMAIFATAGGLWQLYTARIVQGLATGIASGVLGAALIDLAPPEQPALGALVNTVFLTAGMGVGAVITGALVQYAPAPTVLTYVLLLGVFVVFLVSCWVLPETVTAKRQGWRHDFRPRRTTVPAPIRRSFALASTGLVAAFAISGLYLSLRPSLTAKVLHSHSHLAGGLTIFVLFGVGALAQVGLRRLSAQRAALIGAAATVLGAALIDYAFFEASTASFFAGSATLGCGLGLSLKGAFQTIAELTSAAERAEVISAAYIVIYLSLGIPAILAGLGSTFVGLQSTTLIFTAIAKHQGISPHAFMVSVIRTAATNAEKRDQFVADAVAARTEAVESGEGYAAEDVHAYLRARTHGESTSRPKSKVWRK
jgi:MFS family permease